MAVMLPSRLQTQRGKVWGGVGDGMDWGQVERKGRRWTGARESRMQMEMAGNRLAVSEWMGWMEWMCGMLEGACGVCLQFEPSE